MEPAFNKILPPLILMFTVDLSNIILNMFLVHALRKLKKLNTISYRFILYLSISDICAGFSGILYHSSLCVHSILLPQKLREISIALLWIFLTFSGRFIVIIAIDRSIRMRYLTRYNAVMTKKRANLLLASNILIGAVTFIIRTGPFSASFYTKFNSALQIFHVAVMFLGCVLYIWTFCSMKRTADRLNINDGIGMRRETTELKSRPNKTSPTSKNNGKNGDVFSEAHYSASSIEHTNGKEYSNVTKHSNVNMKQEDKPKGYNIEITSTVSSTDPCGIPLPVDKSSEPLTMYGKKTTRAKEYSNITKLRSNVDTKQGNKPNVCNIDIASTVSSSDPCGMTLPGDRCSEPQRIYEFSSESIHANYNGQSQVYENDNIHNNPTEGIHIALENKTGGRLEDRRDSKYADLSRNGTRKHATLTANRYEKDSENKQASTYAKSPSSGKFKQANPQMNEPKQDAFRSHKHNPNKDGRRKPKSKTTTTAQPRRRPYHEFARAVFLIIIALIVCFIPALVLYFYGDAEDRKYGLSSYREYWVDLMVLLNSSLNAVIFITCNSELRVYTKSVLTRAVRKDG